MKAHSSKQTLEQEAAHIDDLLCAVIVNPEEGLIYWKDPLGKMCSGDLAGSTSNGYCRLMYDGRWFHRHRVIFYYVYKYLPVIVDHIQGVENGDSIHNLQAIDASSNATKAKLSRTNSTGFKGVSWNKNANKFTAQIYHNNKKVHLGCYDSAELASIEVERKRKELYPDLYGI